MLKGVCLPGELLRQDFRYPVRSVYLKQKQLLLHSGYFFLTIQICILTVQLEKNSVILMVTAAWQEKTLLLRKVKLQRRVTLNITGND